MSSSILTAPSMFNPAVRERFQQRIGSLGPDAGRRWGRMTSSQMVCHLIDQLRIALGELPTRPVSSVMRYFPIKQLVINVLPWPKGRIQGPAEAFTTVSSEWEKDLTRLQQLLEEFSRREPQTDWPPHPMFGHMNGRLWSQLTCRHFDHHLTQFGV
jgi:Protein of unknown function (DUF1569)